MPAIGLLSRRIYLGLTLLRVDVADANFPLGARVKNKYVVRPRVGGVAAVGQGFGQDGIGHIQTCQDSSGYLPNPHLF